MLSTLLLMASLAGDVLPVQTTFARATRDCVSTTFLKSTAVLDDQRILFELRDGSVWQNTLDSRCPMLGFSEAFSYQARGAQLCDLDTITVFEPHISGATCGLGKFERQAGRMRELRAAARAEKAAAKK
jgi:hypothetical protein